MDMTDNILTLALLRDSRREWYVCERDGEQRLVPQCGPFSSRRAALDCLLRLARCKRRPHTTLLYHAVMPRGEYTVLTEYECRAG